MRCDFCGERFTDDMNGLMAKTFHELLHEPGQVNQV